MADASYQAATYGKQGGAERVFGSGSTLTMDSGSVFAPASGTRITGGIVQYIRTRFTIAQVNAGATLLAAVTGYKYKMVQCSAISIGGAASAVTTVDVIGTQSTAVILVAFGQAALTENTELRAGDTGGVILAAGASFVANDAATAITVGKTGSDVATATHIDIMFSYVLEAA